MVGFVALDYFSSNMFRKWLASFAPQFFDDGLLRTNQLAKKIVRDRPYQKKIRFLDLGVGDGVLTLEIASILKAKEILGLEFVDEYVKAARKKGIRCLKSDLNQKFPYQSNYFDFILSSQTIEHLHDTRRYLQECFRCLKPAGELLILTENLGSWPNIGALIFGWQPFSTTNINGWQLGNPLVWHLNEPKNRDFFEKYQATGISGTVGHVRVLTYQGLRDLLKKVGFVKIEISARAYFPLRGSLSDKLCSIDKRHGHFLIANCYKRVRI